MHVALEVPHYKPAELSVVKAFAKVEEADEKDGVLGAKMASRISMQIVPGMTAPRSLDQQIDDFRDVLQKLPKPDVSASSPSRSMSQTPAMDAAELTPTLALDVFNLLLRPDCPSPAISKPLVFRILIAAIDALRDGGPVVDAPLPAGQQRQIIVGDTHGQLQDVLTILLTHGVPSATNRYIWNGDIADRGPNAVEIFMLVLLFQLLCPGSSFVTRGNHEARDINERPASTGGGFYDEVSRKYDNETFELFQLYFMHMPLAVSLGGQIIVVHGGLTRGRETSLESIRRVRYRRDVPQAPNGAGENVLFDLLWSDPQDEEGIAFGARGDDTIKWGPDVTREFLAASGAELVVRSHQVPAGGRGYGMHHDNKVVTVFSASNYGGVCRNMGAVLIVPSSGSLGMKEHMALTLEELRKEHLQQKAEQARKSTLAGSFQERLLGGNSKKSLADPNAFSRKSVGWAAARKSMGAGDILPPSRRASAGRLSVGSSGRRLLGSKSAASSSSEQFYSQEEVDESTAKILDQVLTSVRGRVCRQRQKLRGALAARHEALCAAGKARSGGGLLPLSEWRRVLTDVLELDVDWAALPPRAQSGLAHPVHTPPQEQTPQGASTAQGDAEAEPSAPVAASQPPLLDPLLYPAVWWEQSVDRFQVRMRSGTEEAASLGAGAAASGVSSDLLSLCFVQALPLRKALVGAVTQNAATPGRSVRLSAPRAVFISAVKALADAVAEAEQAGGEQQASVGQAPPPIGASEFEALADAAPSEGGEILYQQFLASLVVVDTEEGAEGGVANEQPGKQQAAPRWSDVLLPMMV